MELMYRYGAVGPAEIGKALGGIGLHGSESGAQKIAGSDPKRVRAGDGFRQY